MKSQWKTRHIFYSAATSANILWTEIKPNFLNRKKKLCEFLLSDLVEHVDYFITLLQCQRSTWRAVTINIYEVSFERRRYPYCFLHASGEFPRISHNPITEMRVRPVINTLCLFFARLQ